MWLLLAIYASTDYKERRLLWHEAGVLLDQGIPTVMVGDFNCITSQDEKRGGRPFSPNLASQDFCIFLTLMVWLILVSLVIASHGAITALVQLGFGSGLIRHLLI